MATEKIIGIDLGTSNSQAAVMLGGKPTIVPSAEGATIAGKMFPSVVAFTKDGELLVGEPARRQTITNPEGTVMAIKRKMGTDHKVKLHGKTYTPQQISAFILQKIKRDSEAFLGEPVKKVVITVPAYFATPPRGVVRNAGRTARLEVLRIVDEPTAPVWPTVCANAQTELSPSANWEVGPSMSRSLTLQVVWLKSDLRTATHTSAWTIGITS